MLLHIRIVLMHTRSYTHGWSFLYIYSYIYIYIYIVGGAAAPPTLWLAPPTFRFATPTFVRFGGFLALKLLSHLSHSKLSYLQTLRHSDSCFYTLVCQNINSMSHLSPPTFFKAPPMATYYLFKLEKVKVTKASVGPKDTVLKHYCQTQAILWFSPYSFPRTQASLYMPFSGSWAILEDESQLCTVSLDSSDTRRAAAWRTKPS